MSEYDRWQRGSAANLSASDGDCMGFVLRQAWAAKMKFNLY